jgi:hypothetical protein
MSPVEKAVYITLINWLDYQKIPGKSIKLPNAILNLAGPNHYIDNYPPDNLDKGSDFTELSAIGVSLEDTYGPRGGRGWLCAPVALPSPDALKILELLAGVADLAFVVLPLQSAAHRLSHL